MANTTTNGKKVEVATLAGGCFWCMEAAFQKVAGVLRVVPGYTGGTKSRPTYEDVCSGATGHAESVNITFDPSTISFREIVEIFLTVHDPTQLNRQGADVGTQYRSAIFYHDSRQKQEAEEVIKQLEAKKVWNAPIATEIARAGEFYPAEDYHIDYYNRHPAQPYCMAVISPKLVKLTEKWASKLKEHGQGAGAIRRNPSLVPPLGAQLFDGFGRFNGNAKGRILAFDCPYYGLEDPIAVGPVQ